MALDNVTLTRFRNHAESRIDGALQFNLLVGENGAGKTNFLEALSLLAPGRGLRRAALPEMAASSGAGGFALSAMLDCGDDREPVRLATGASAEQPGRRLVQVNGAPSSAIGLGEWLAMAWLTPAMDRLFVDAASARRRYMDRLAVALDPFHARVAGRYEAALRERNRLLGADDEPEARWFEAIETQMAEYGADLSRRRADLVARLAAELVAHPEGPFARPAIVYAPGGPPEAGELAASLATSRARDRAARRSLTGPHRDELEVTLASKNMPAARCSTGEQKAMLVALTLAHAALAEGGRPSVLLLDEIAAHLDPLRRAALFERLRSQHAQVWMTGTELAPFDDIAREAAIWRMKGGCVERVG